MDKKKTPDTDDLDANTPESETEEKVDAVSLEEEVSIGESIKTAPLTFIQEKRAQAPTVISKGKPAKPEPELKMWVAARCNLGAIRDRNEDSCLVYTSKVGGHFTMMPFGLYIVADGMGGHANGHIASKTASRMMARNVINKIYMPLLEDKPNSTPIQEVMADAVRMANTAVYEIDESDSGTTLTTALILGRRLHVAHVGDSRIYLMTEGELEAVTEDHSLLNDYLKVHKLTNIGTCCCGLWARPKRWMPTLLCGCCPGRENCYYAAMDYAACFLTRPLKPLCSKISSWMKPPTN
ncbi:MAG: PP2C family protein-serine/threonine phosphatase [Anaerolineae bacterium]